MPETTTLPTATTIPELNANLQLIHNSILKWMEKINTTVQHFYTETDRAELNTKQLGCIKPNTSPDLSLTTCSARNTTKQRLPPSPLCPTPPPPCPPSLPSTPGPNIQNQIALFYPNLLLIPVLLFPVYSNPFHAPPHNHYRFYDTHPSLHLPPTPALWQPHHPMAKRPQDRGRGQQLHYRPQPDSSPPPQQYQ